MDRKFYKGAERYNEMGRFVQNEYTRIADMNKLYEITGDISE
jgi:hypothetical protein